MKFIPQIRPTYGAEERKAVCDYLNSPDSWLTEYTYTKAFEEMICKFTGAKYCSIVSNGTVSLFAILKALNIGPGDEVIVPDLTMSATPNVVVLAGAKVVFVDVERESLCLDVKKTEKAITPKTRAVMHVSLNGRAGDLLKLKKLCQKRKIYLIEDSAQSLGSFYRGKQLGRYGIAGSFSFSMAKIVTSGQGAAIITDNANLLKEVKYVRDFGRRKKGEDFWMKMGWNFKYTDLLAVFGIEQMKKIKKHAQIKKNIFKSYQGLLADVPEVKFIETDFNEVTPWVVDAFVPRRDELMAFLKENGIGTRPSYPALHSQPAYHSKGDFPVTEYAAKNLIWLPSFLTLTEQQIKYICGKIKSFYAQK